MIKDTGVAKMSLTDKLKEIKKKAGEEAFKIVEEVKPAVKSGINKGKEFAYKTVAIVEKKAGELGEKIEKREGVLGDIANVVEGATQTVKEIHYKVQEKGGYKAVAKDAFQKAKGAVEETYSKFEQAITTNGKYDSEKAKELLKDSANATRQFGEKAVHTLADLVKQGARKLGDDYRYVVPSKEERETKYAGIGTKYDGVLLRKHYDNCLKFYDEAGKKLPKNLKYRDEILTDIKESASGNAKELKNFYFWGSVPHAKEKEERTVKYL